MLLLIRDKIADLKFQNSDWLAVLDKYIEAAVIVIEEATKSTTDLCSGLNELLNQLITIRTKEYLGGNASKFFTRQKEVCVAFNQFFNLFEQKKIYQSPLNRLMPGTGTQVIYDELYLGLLLIELDHTNYFKCKPAVIGNGVHGRLKDHFILYDEPGLKTIKIFFDENCDIPKSIQKQVMELADDCSKLFENLMVNKPHL